MPSPGSPSDFVAWKLLAVVMVLGGLYSIFSGSGVLGVLVGIGLIVGAGTVYRRGKEARAGYIHEQRMTGLWNWAQGLGPRKRGGK
jgi:hypothetical protein